MKYLTTMLKKMVRDKKSMMKASETNNQSPYKQLFDLEFHS